MNDFNPAISKLVAYFDGQIAEKDRRIERLEEALRPFGDYLCRKMLGHDGDPVPSDWREHACGECETCRARAALPLVSLEDR